MNHLQKTKNKMRVITISIILFSCLSVSAQVKWTGAGDGSSWGDAANWDTNRVPASTDTAQFSKNATVLSGSNINIAALKIQSRAKVRLAVDLSIHSENANDHCITMGVGTQLELGAENTPNSISLTGLTGKNCINNNSSADSAVLIINKGASVNFAGSTNGIALSGPHSTLTNYGTINIANSVKTGIRMSGKADNHGNINTINVATDGIFVAKGTFKNHQSGKINLSKSSDDGIEIVDRGTFENWGNLDIILSDSATTIKNGIAIGTKDSLGTFVNYSDTKINGGTSIEGRSIFVYERGTLINLGHIQAQGGNPSATIYSRWEVENGKNAKITLNNGRINVNKGNLINRGLIHKIGGESGISSADSTSFVINEAFYRYDSSFVFATGNATIINKGIRLNAMNRGKVEADAKCEAFITKAAYEWSLGNDVYGTTNADGILTFAPQSLPSDSIILKTAFEDISVRVLNICADAILSSVNDEAFNASVWIYPTLINSGGEVRLVSTTASLDNTKMTVTDMMGRTISSMPLSTDYNVILAPTQPGTYFITVSQNQKITTKKLVVIH